MKNFVIPAILASVAFSSISFASDRPDHFQGKPSATVEQAVVNLKEYNAKLAILVNKDKLSLQELGQVHQITYTLERALEKLREEHEQVGELLEKVHVASEASNVGVVKNSGREYLKRTQKLVN